MSTVLGQTFIEASAHLETLLCSQKERSRDVTQRQECLATYMTRALQTEPSTHRTAGDFDVDCVHPTHGCGCG